MLEIIGPFVKIQEFLVRRDRTIESLDIGTTWLPRNQGGTVLCTARKGIKHKNNRNRQRRVIHQTLCEITTDTISASACLS